MNTPRDMRQENPTTPTTPQRAVATYGTYEEAERAVDYLSDHEFPVQRTAIVGRGLDMVEDITGRYTYWSAAGKGAGNGAIIGALFGWLFGLLGWVAPLIADLLLALYGALFGAVIGGILGALLGIAGHAGTGGRRDFSSVPRFRAESYQLLVDAEVADRAQQVLNSPGAPGVGEAEQ